MTSFMRYEVPWTLDFFIDKLERAKQPVVPGKSRPVSADFFCGDFINASCGRENSRFASTARENWRKFSANYYGNASANIQRNWVPSRYLQDYERCTHWGILWHVWQVGWLVNMLQDTPSLYLSFHNSYYVLKLAPSFSITMTLYYQYFDTHEAFSVREIDILY